MCQPLSAGGRRCAIHTHTATAVIRLAAKSSGLTRYQTERLFSELTREGRRAVVPSEETQKRAWQTGELLSRLLIEANDQFSKDKANAEQHDREIDGPSWYAFQTIVTRAQKRSAALKTVFEKVADKTGLTVLEVQHKYETIRDSSTRERGAEYPPEYTPNTRRLAVLANVPYDVASVVALEKIKNLQQSSRPRISEYTEIPEPSAIKRIGYNEGRLEVEYRTITGGENKTAYRDVPEEIWSKMKTSPWPAAVLAEHVSGKREYLYANQEEADADGQVHRCASCGQFALQSHSCPNREVREKLVEQVGVKNVEKDFLSNPEVAHRYETENATPAPVEETVDVETVPVPDNTPLPAAEFPALKLDQGILNPKKYPTNWNTTVPGFMFGSEQAKDNMNPTIPGTINDQITNPDNLLNVAHELSGNNIQYYTNYFPGNIKLTPEYEQVMKDKPDYIKPVFFLNRSTGEKGYAGAYDERYYVSQSAYAQPFTIRRAFKAEGLYETSLTHAQELKVEASEHLDKFRELEDVVKIDPIASVTKRQIDKTAGNKQPATRVGDARQIKKALREGKAILVPAYMEMNRATSIPVDDHGYGITTARSNVEGQMVFRRNTDGTIETLSKDRTLKCSCYAYRVNYYCEHISYAHRHFANVIAQIATPPATQDVNPRIKLLGVALAARENITIKDEDTDNPTIVFTNTVNPNSYGQDVTRENINDFAWRVETPQHLLNLPEQISFEQAKEIIDHDAKVRDLWTVITPNRMGEVRTALRKADVTVPVTGRFGRYGGDVTTGTITYKKTSRTEIAEVKEHDLKCTCQEYQDKYDCEHVRMLTGNSSLILSMRARNATAVNPWPVVTAEHREATVKYVQVVAEMNRSGVNREAAEAIIAQRQAAEEAERATYRARMEQRQAERDALRAAEREKEAAERAIQNAETVTNTQGYVNRMTQKWENHEGSYAETPNLFYQDVTAALRRKEKGEEVIHYLHENVTDGMADPENPGSRAFGVELEFELKPPEGMSHYEAKEAIAKELYEKGLTDTAYQQGYHSGRRSGWANWSFEEDSTVGGGEIVSPLLRDTPKDWKQLSDVLDVMKKYGAVTSNDTGSHIHVSTASYGESTAKNAQLLRDTNADADMLYRLATNPKKGKHRGMEWCRPNVDDKMGDISDELLDGHRVLTPIQSDNHNIGVNFGGATNNLYSKNHVEFRQWDATLDKGIIQQQIVVSLGLVDRAERTVVAEKGTSKTPKTKHNVGTHRAKERDLTGGTRKKLSKEDFFELNNEAMNFIDSVARNPINKANIAALFAITKWQDLR